MGDQYLSFEQIQQRELEMMKYVDGICRKEGLTYWMSGGTLLGAARHRGFIPWDDDVDLMMPRPDYERLLALAPKYDDRRYVFVHPRFDGKATCPWLRAVDLGTYVEPSGLVKDGLGHLFLDVFPVDALPTNPLLSRLRFVRVRLYDILVKCARRANFKQGERLQWLKNAVKWITFGREASWFACRIDRFCSRKDLNRAKYVGVQVIPHYGIRERMPVEAIRGTVMLPFCDGEYPAPVGWKTYLTNLYGDYMQLPPEEKRRTIHNLRTRTTLIDAP